MPALDTPAIVEIGGYAPTRGAGSINWSRAFYEIAAQAQPLQKSNADGGLIRVVELPHLDGPFVECIEQAGVDAHFTEIFAKGSASACRNRRSGSGEYRSSDRPRYRPSSRP
jgi:hypothetical protein